jgi:hypothetical protein
MTIAAVEHRASLRIIVASDAARGMNDDEHA